MKGVYLSSRERKGVFKVSREESKIEWKTMMLKTNESVRLLASSLQKGRKNYTSTFLSEHLFKISYLNFKRVYKELAVV